MLKEDRAFVPDTQKGEIRRYKEAKKIIQISLRGFLLEINFNIKKNKQLNFKEIEGIFIKNIDKVLLREKSDNRVLLVGKTEPYNRTRKNIIKKIVSFYFKKFFKEEINNNFTLREIYREFKTNFINFIDEEFELKDEENISWSTAEKHSFPVKSEIVKYIDTLLKNNKSGLSKNEIIDKVSKDPNFGKNFRGKIKLKEQYTVDKNIQNLYKKYNATEIVKNTVYYFITKTDFRTIEGNSESKIFKQKLNQIKIVTGIEDKKVNEKELEELKKENIIKVKTNKEEKTTTIKKIILEPQNKHQKEMITIKNILKEFLTIIRREALIEKLKEVVNKEMNESLKKRIKFLSEANEKISAEDFKKEINKNINQIKSEEVKKEILRILSSISGEITREKLGKLEFTLKDKKLLGTAKGFLFKVFSKVSKLKEVPAPKIKRIPSTVHSKERDYSKPTGDVDSYYGDQQKEITSDFSKDIKNHIMVTPLHLNKFKEIMFKVIEKENKKNNNKNLKLQSVYNQIIKMNQHSFWKGLKWDAEEVTGGWIRYATYTPKWVHISEFQSDIFRNVLVNITRNPKDDFSKMLSGIDIMKFEEEYYKIALSRIVAKHSSAKIFTIRDAITANHNAALNMKKAERYYENLPPTLGFKKITMTEEPKGLFAKVIGTNENLLKIYKKYLNSIKTFKTNKIWIASRKNVFEDFKNTLFSLLKEIF